MGILILCCIEPLGTPKVNIHIIYDDRTTPFTGRCPTEMYIHIHQTCICIRMFFVLFVVAENQKPPKYPSGEDCFVIYSYSGIFY